MFSNPAFLKYAPDRFDQSSLPGFTVVQKGQASENRVDEKEILIDKDQTVKPDIRTARRVFDSQELTLEPLEDLPADFMRGEIDVREQMDRAADAIEASLQGLQNQGSEDSPRGELGASFHATPGGLDEVGAKTDEYLASHSLGQKNIAHRHYRKPHRRHR